MLIRPLIGMFILAGPIGSFFMDLADERYDRLAFQFIATIILTICTTYLWSEYFQFIVAKKKGKGKRS